MSLYCFDIACHTYGPSGICQRLFCLLHGYLSWRACTKKQNYKHSFFFLTEEAKYNPAHSAGVIGSESVLAQWCLKGFRGEFTLGYNITAAACCTNQDVNLSCIAEDFVILKCSDLCRRIGNHYEPFGLNIFLDV